MELYRILAVCGRPDARAHRVKLAAFVVDVAREGYPPVPHILFPQTSRKHEVLPWNAVESVNHAARQIKVKDIEASELAPEEWLRRKVLLSDVHDSLILDLEHLRAARANGLLLKEENERLLLCG